MKLILNSKQFSCTNKCLLKEKEVEMNKLIRELKNNKIIDPKLFWKLHSTSSNVPVLYNQPKLHKAGLPMRPVTSSIGSYNYPLSKYLASKIAQCKQPTSSYMKDSFEFVTTILRIKPDK